MRRRCLRFASALALAAGVAVLAPAADPTGPSGRPGTAAASPPVGGTSTVTEIEVVESVGAAGQVVDTSATQYRVVTTTSCRRTPQGRVCSHTSVRLPVADETPPATETGGSQRGSASSYAFMVTDSQARPAHWNRCSTIRYRVNPTGLPAGALIEVHTAVRKLATASGLTFSYAGTTSVVPYQPGWTSSIPASQNSDIFIAWSDERAVPGLAGGVAGLGGPSYSSSGGREPRIVRGGVVLDRAAPVAPGFGNGASRGTLLMHELGHAVNLGHVRDRYQVMHPTVTADSRGDLQVGDRAGLSRLRSYGCF